MKRGGKLILLLSVLIVAVCAYAIISNIQTDKVVENSGTKLVDVPAGNITSLTWDIEGQENRFERKDKSWQNSADAAFPVDQSGMDSLLKVVSTVTANNTIAGVTDFSQYGLDKPVMTVKVGYADGTKNVYELGNINPVTNNYYMRLDNGGDVLLIDSSIFGAFSMPLSRLITKESIPTMGTPVGVNVKNIAGDLNLVYLEDNGGAAYSDLFHWFQQVNGSYRAVDETGVSSFVTIVSRLRWNDVASYNATGNSLAQYGLDKPQAVITIQYKAAADSGAANNKQFTLELGKNDSNGDCYARIQGSKMVYLIDGETADILIRLSYNELVPREVCYIDINKLQRIDVLLNGTTYRVDIDRSGKDAVYTYNGKKLDGSTMLSMLAGLRDLKASGSATGSGAAQSEAIGFTFYRDAGKYSQMTAHFYTNDSASYLVDFNGERRQLVAKADIDKLVKYADSLFITPPASSSPKPGK